MSYISFFSALCNQRSALAFALLHPLGLCTCLPVSLAWCLFIHFFHLQTCFAWEHVSECRLLAGHRCNFTHLQDDLTCVFLLYGQLYGGRDIVIKSPVTHNEGRDHWKTKIVTNHSGLEVVSLTSWPPLGRKRHECFQGEKASFGKPTLAGRELINPTRDLSTLLFFLFI